MKTPSIILQSVSVCITLVMCLLLGCHRDSGNVENGVPVVTVGDSTLMADEVVRQIPYGLESEDSVAMFRSIVETWLRRQVLVEVARENISNMDDIDRMVEDYRADLILNRYLAMVDDHGRKTVNDRAINRYYKEHGDSLLTEEPLVKGIFLKVRQNDAMLPMLRSSMSNPDDKSVDNLERNGLRGAVQYEYFQDQWHAWHEVAELVPYRFEDADEFLRTTKDFETNYGGSVYLVHISDYVPTGSRMPEDYARQRIRTRMLQSNVIANREKVIAGIYRREMDKGNIRKGLYDPATGKLSAIPSNEKKKNKNDE